VRSGPGSHLPGLVGRAGGQLNNGFAAESRLNLGVPEQLQSRVVIIDVDNNGACLKASKALAATLKLRRDRGSTFEAVRFHTVVALVEERGRESRSHSSRPYNCDPLIHDSLLLSKWHPRRRRNLGTGLLSLLSSTKSKGRSCPTESRGCETGPCLLALASTPLLRFSYF